MKNWLLITASILIICACSSTKKQIPIDNAPISRAPIEIYKDSLFSGQQSFPESGILLRSSDFSIKILERILQSSSPDYIMLYDTLGINNLFSMHVITGKNISYVAEDRLHPGKLAELLKFYGVQLGVVIDPNRDKLSDLDPLFSTLKSWEIPVSHWQIGYLPYLQQGIFTWDNGEDFVRKSSLFANKVTNFFSNASIYFAAGSEQYNVFTDQMIEYLKANDHRSGIALSNFPVNKKSTYHTLELKQTHILQTDGTELRDIVTQHLKNALDLSSTSSVKMITWEINPQAVSLPVLLKAFGLQKSIFKNAISIRTIARQSDENDHDPAIYYIELKGDTGDIIIINNPADDTIFANLNGINTYYSRYYEFDKNLDTLGRSLKSNLLTIPPKQIALIGKPDKIISSSKRLANPFGLSVSLVDSSSIFLVWPPLKNASSFSIDYGLHPDKPSHKLETTSFGIKIDSLRKGRTYFFTLNALDTLNTSIAVEHFKYDAVPPTTPKPPILRVINNQLVMSWEPVPFANYYTIRQYNHGEILETTVAQDVHELVFNELMTQREYTFAIKAGNQLGETEFSRSRISNVEIATAKPPYNVVLEGNKISWKDTINLLKNYSLYFGQDIANMKIIRSGIVDTVFIIENDSLFRNGGFLSLKSFSSNGESKDFSNIVSLKSSQSNNKVYIFDSYATGDSTTFVVKYDGLAPDQASLILQNRRSKAWNEIRYDLTPYKSQGLQEYRIKLPTSEIEHSYTTSLVSAMYGQKRVYSAVKVKN